MTTLLKIGDTTIELTTWIAIPIIFLTGLGAFTMTIKLLHMAAEVPEKDRDKDRPPR